MLSYKVKSGEVNNWGKKSINAFFIYLFILATKGKERIKTLHQSCEFYQCKKKRKKKNKRKKRT
jgi:hypothetical protein